MLTVFSRDSERNCAGMLRRNFLKIGSLAGLGLTLPGLLKQRAADAAAGKTVKSTSVIWLWLSGGPTHIETFDPKMTAPSEYRSVTGEVATPLAGVTVGGTFPRIASVADKMALVRSFAHKNSGHGGGTHWVMTGYDNRMADNGGVPNRPSLGSITARYRGSNHPETGMPTYVRLNNIGADGPTFLGPSYAPFETGGQSRKNMQLAIEHERLADRHNLLAKMDTINRDMDRKGLMSGLDAFEQQAYDLVLGKSQEAFDIKKEDSKLLERYGKGIGEQLLLARRLCEAGAGFVTINYGGWDMHGNIQDALKRRSPDLDRAVATLIEDLHERGQNENVLLVITGEFGRTPKVNKNGGRDHWAPLSTLALAGGGLKMGQVVGESADKADIPASLPIGPLDLMATVFHVLGIPQNVQYTNAAGRPVYMNTDGKPIGALI